MREQNIRIEPFQFLNIRRLQIQKAPNEHPTVFLEGTILDTETDAVVERNASNRKLIVTAVEDSGTKRVLFNGLIQELRVHTENGLRVLTVHGISHTVSMDQEKRIRAFQNGNTKYQKIVDSIEGDSTEFGVLIQEHGEERIERTIIQYKETDWEFAKRAASRLHTVVIPNSTLNNPYISIGPTHSSRRYDITPIAYAIRKDVSGYRVNTHSHVRITERDMTCYEVKSREIYELCDNINFQGRKLMVYSVTTQFEQEELFHTYLLKEREGFCCKEYYNENLIGASLEGTIADIERDEVTVSLSDDRGGQRLYPYATPYSTPDGTGWYFMPEPGDAVRLQFPNEHEEDAYAISAVHVTHGRRNDPDTKFISTKYGKKVLFRPGSISITNGHGSSVVLSDAEGIKLETSKSIRMSADGNVMISGQGKVIVRGNDGVDVVQNDSFIHIADDIDLSSGHTRIR